MFDVELLLKYVLEGVAVALVAYMILRERVSQEEILTIALTAAAAFAVLDALSPAIGLGARIGTGMSLGSQLIPEGYQEAY